ncbi:protein of unknown function [Variovorax sp. EL159]|nr:protein of unknown function [Variovorax sp. EL159]
MMKFGNPERFEISAQWLRDAEPRELLPKDFGWSMGELKIVVGGVSLTDHQIHGEQKDAIRWYLGPVIAWLIREWKWLMHEEAYAWPTRPADSSAITVSADLQRFIASEYRPDREIYKTIREWWARHALHSADPSALYPDVFIRRVEDNVEISWLDQQPDFPPDGFELKLKPGTALLPVEDVAEPLWNFLKWAVKTAPALEKEDKHQVAILKSKLTDVKGLAAAELEAAHFANEAIRSVIENARKASHWVPNRRVLPDAPVIAEFDTPALMFGGLNVNFGEQDILRLFDLLVQHRVGGESDGLKSLVSSPSIYEFIQPYAHGYELAYAVRESLGIDHQTAFVDIHQIVYDLGIKIHSEALDTASVRGVAIAGAGLSPAILINEKNKFNASKGGRRFTLAHELCHILFDRSSAKRLSHVSGPWASIRVEKRANAFAAMFLATPHALSKALTGAELSGQMKNLSERFGIGIIALREHMHNLDLISDEEFQQGGGWRH